MGLKRFTSKLVVAAALAIGVFSMAGGKAMAVTRYVSDGVNHAQGYIFVGESHAAFCSHALPYNTDASGKVRGTADAYYRLTDTKEAVTVSGAVNMFIMTGNVFFVFEGNDVSDGNVQSSREYIYSDGRGTRGRAVSKIREIMAGNPNVAHWNIISWQGHVSARNDTANGDNAQYYVASYRNWINSEFPGSSVYFLSHGLKTKYFRGKANAGKINAALAQNFPGRYLDYTSFLNSKADRTVDGIHYEDPTYYTLVTNVIKSIEAGQVSAPAVPASSPAVAASAGNPAAAPVDFDAAFYASMYPDLALNGLVTPAQLLDHYIRFGKNEGRICVRP